MIPYYLLRSLALILIGLAIYAQTFHFDFVFDDYLFIVTNPFIKNFNNFHVMWHAFPMTRFIGMCSFALNYYFNQLAPQGYHIFNFIVHLVNVGLVWALADLLFKITKFLPSKNRVAQELPFIIALLFLVHPCQTQAVTYITQRFESMATGFYLGTIYVYLQARLSTNRVQQIILFALAGFLALLGILTKEVFVTMPVMILACEWILFPKRDNKKLYLILAIAGILLFLLVSKLVHAGLNTLFKTFLSESHDGDIFTPMKYFLTQMRVFLTFMRLFIFPLHQNLDYDYPASTSLFNPPLTMLGLMVIGGMLWLVIKLRRVFPLIALGLAWILITFSINLVPRTNVIFEHKLYLISFGFFLAAVVFLSMVIQNGRTLVKILTCIIAILSVVSFQRNKVWANELLLWEDSIKNSPNKARVNASLGRTYGTLGRLDDSIKYLSKAITLHPDNITYENRGVIYSLQGLMPQAMEDLNKSINMDPKYSLPYIKRAWIYHEEHDDEAAMADLQQAIQLDPYFSDAFLERGMIWMAIGKYTEALKDFQQVLNIDPFNTQASQFKSYCLTKLGRK